MKPLPDDLLRLVDPPRLESGERHPITDFVIWWLLAFYGVGSLLAIVWLVGELIK